MKYDPAMATTRPFGEQVKELRLAAGLSQFEAAVLLSYRPETISRWETGGPEPSRPHERAAIIAALKKAARKRPPAP